jgi:hypothetical protein
MVYCLAAPGDMQGTMRVDFGGRTVWSSQVSKQLADVALQDFRPDRRDLSENWV